MSNIKVDDSPEARMRYAVFKAVEYGATAVQEIDSRVLSYGMPIPEGAWHATGFKWAGFMTFVDWLQESDLQLHVDHVRMLAFFWIFEAPAEKQKPIRVGLPLWTKEQKRAAGLRQRIVIEWCAEHKALTWLEAGSGENETMRQQLTHATEVYTCNPDRPVPSGFTEIQVQALINTLLNIDKNRHIQRGY